jgi:hypothetical protein
MRKIILLLILLLPLLGSSQSKDNYTIVTVYNGIPFRPSVVHYSAEASIEEFKSKGLGQTDQGLSLNYELIAKGDFSLGLKYYRTLFLYFPILYVAAQPDFYRINNQNGFNIRPEIGFQYDPIWQYTIGLRFKLSYGYDVPIANGEGFSYNRSIIELKIGITFNVHHSTSY